MPGDTTTPRGGRAPRLRTGYEWPVWIAIFYLWQTIVVVLAQFCLFYMLAIEAFFRLGGGWYKPREPLLDTLTIAVLVVNSALLVCTVAETVWCSHDTLTANTFLGCQTAKSLYVGCVLFLVFRGSSGPSTFKLWFLRIGTAGLICGSPIVGVIYGIVIKVQSRSLELRGEEQPLLAGDWLFEVPESPEAAA